jgi:hypothetical protein
MNYEWIRNGPSSTTFFEPGEISKAWSESLFWLGMTYGRYKKEQKTNTPATETPTPAVAPKTRKH